MGRGRQKAKQTKVARALKYSSPHTDYDALQRELSGGQPVDEAVDIDNEEFSDEYDDGTYSDEYDDEYDSNSRRATR
jgi:hypothetical protein